ncbi:MAG: HAD family hydrolase [candidate division WOR-3 bacterium]|nr:HAD family hydrolase [candidate division WOR-3 bacterium]
MAIIALIFDFDDTLVPDSTTLLLRKYGIDPEVFWKTKWQSLITSGYDPALACLNLLLDNIGEGKPLGPLTNSDLNTFGAELQDKFYPGLPELFDFLREFVSQKVQDVSIEFYIISGGLQEIIEASPFIRENFKGVYASQLASDTPNGVLKHIKRCVTFTEKTRYLFEINKGILPKDTIKRPYAVNEDVPKENRRVKIHNMIYVGDGLTDIPCFSLVLKERGIPLGIIKAEDPKSTVIQLLAPRRVVSAHLPNYNDDHELGIVIRNIVATFCTRIEIDRASAIRSQNL